MAKDLAKDPRVIAFADAARRFCRLIESHRKLKRRDFIYRCAELLPELQLQAMRLLTLKPPLKWGHPCLPHPPVQHFFRRKRALARKIGPKDHYWMVYNPLGPLEPDEPYQYVISGDLAEIYDDLVPGVRVFGRDNVANDRRAVHLWASWFVNHWGHHSVSAMRPLQELVEEYENDFS